MGSLMESAVLEETSGDGPSDGLRPSRVTKEEGSARNLEPQVFPVEVLLFDRVDLILAAIGLDGFLTADGFGDFVMGFKPDQAGASSLLRETFKQAFAMLPDALNEV